MTKTSSAIQRRRNARSGRLPILSRGLPEELPGLRLTDRDRKIVETVHVYRALTTPQITTLLFNGNEAYRVCQRRLQRLYQHGFLARGEQAQRRSDGSRPLVYFLDHRGARLLAESDHRSIDWDPRDNDVASPFLAHLLLTNQVRLAVTIAAQAVGARLVEWIDDKTLKSSQMKDYVVLSGPQGGQRRVAVVPDGYFVLRMAGKDFRHFLEVDRATVTARYSRYGSRDWRHKIKAYLAYYRSGTYQARYGGRGLRILTVTTGRRRLAHLKAITEAAGGRTRFWFTTFDELASDTALTAPIWRVATSGELRALLAA
jgi:hypothetical protein